MNFKKGLAIVAGATVGAVITTIVVKRVKKSAEIALRDVAMEMAGDLEVERQNVTEQNVTEQDVATQNEVVIMESVNGDRIKVVYSNDSKEKALKYMEDLINGKFDHVLDSSILGNLRNDKQRALEKLESGKSIEEVFNEIQHENLEITKQQLGEETDYREIVDICNSAMNDDTISIILETIKDVASEDEYEVLKGSIEAIKDVKFEYIEE